MLVGFDSFFRKSNLVLKSFKDYDPSKPLLRKDILVHLWSVVICMTWTIQFRARQPLVPVVHLPSNHPLCPIQGNQWHLCLFLTPLSLATFLHFGGDLAAPITHSVFTNKLCNSFSLARFKASNYSGHSFHHRGALFTFHCGALVELTSLWHNSSSDAMLLHIAQPLEHRLSMARLITENISSPCTVLTLPFAIHLPFLLSGSLGRLHQGSGPILAFAPLLLPWCSYALSSNQ